MPSIRETITQTVVSILSAGSPPGKVTRSNTFTRNDADGSLPAMVVYPLVEKVTRAGDSVSMRTFSLMVDCQAKDAPPIDSKLDILFLWVVQKLLADDTLGGLVYRVEETSTEWTIDVLDEDIGSARLTFDIIYATNRSDPAIQRNG